MIILAVADDPAAPREIAAVAGERGWSMDTQMTDLGLAFRLIADRA